MTDRRKFIKKGTYVALGGMILPYACASKKNSEGEKPEVMNGESVEKSIKKIGVQAYSVRDALQEDFSGSMKKIADMGYEYIEAYGLSLDGKLFGMTPAEYKKIVDDLGMKVISSHATYFTPDQAPALIEASQAAGLEYLVIPWLGEELRTDYMKIADNLNKVGELVNQAGLKFGYHNHNFEFEKQGDKYPLEIMLENTDPDLVTFEMDIYWVVNAGADPMALINKYPGRFSLYHVKDANPELEQTTVGQGIIDFKELLSARKKAGLDYYFVEDERTDDPFGNLKAAIDYLNQLEF